MSEKKYSHKFIKTLNNSNDMQTENWNDVQTGKRQESQTLI